MTVIRDRAKNGGQGMNWIRKDLRISLYMRDALACVYCARTIEDGMQFTLDHLVPHSEGGTNDPTNIVTCCHQCNSARGNRDWKVFAGTVAAYLNHGITAEMIIAHVETTRYRSYDRQQAKAILARRASFADALHTLRTCI